MLCWFFLKKNEWLTPIILVFFLHGKTYASHFFTKNLRIAFLYEKLTHRKVMKEKLTHRKVMKEKLTTGMAKM